MQKARIYRVIEIEDTLDFNELGIHWSFDLTAVEDIAENLRLNLDKCIFITSVVAFYQIDWDQTVANMQVPEYEEELECFLKESEPIKFEVLRVGADVDSTLEEDETYIGNTGKDFPNDETMVSTEYITKEDIKEAKIELLEWIETN